MEESARLGANRNDSEVCLMEAVILAGGFGTRLRHVVPDLPKPMAPVGGRPFLEYLLRSLAGKGFRRIVLSLGYLAEKVTAHFGDTFCGMQLVFENERSPLGTGGAVRQSLLRCREDHLFVFNGDTFLDLEVAEVERQWRYHRLPIVVACTIDNTERYGRLELRDGRVVSISEKGRSGVGLINAGCYLLPADVFSGIAVGESFSLERDVLPDLVSRDRLDCFISKGYFIDIGVPEDYERAQAELPNLLA
jgi:D-glycero-alpha-D-manno-heptose 1-phosphate guanylyltransferase